MERKSVIARRDFAPKDDRRPPWLSRDWDMEGRIKCACKDCIANDGKGKCACPALMEINEHGKCSSYQKADVKPYRKKKKHPRKK